MISVHHLFHDCEIGTWSSSEIPSSIDLPTKNVQSKNGLIERCLFDKHFQVTPSIYVVSVSYIHVCCHYVKQLTKSNECIVSKWPGNPTFCLAAKRRCLAVSSSWIRSPQVKYQQLSSCASTSYIISLINIRFYCRLYHLAMFLHRCCGLEKSYYPHVDGWDNKILASSSTKSRSGAGLLGS